jgi:hypothetical protein
MIKGEHSLKITLVLVPQYIASAHPPEKCYRFLGLIFRLLLVGLLVPLEFIARVIALVFSH